MTGHVDVEVRTEQDDIMASITFSIVKHIHTYILIRLTFVIGEGIFEPQHHTTQQRIFVSGRYRSCRVCYCARRTKVLDRAT